MFDSAIFKRVFSKKKQEESVSKSHRYTISMWRAIEQLAAQAGETPNAFVILIVDQYLQVQLEKGLLNPDTVSTKEKTA